ncbi:MAG: DUF1932 domain-containing protein [Rhodobacter sp.]|nr:DUF1932 domain-containing protein [Rhodobacter sp.]
MNIGFVGMGEAGSAIVSGWGNAQSGIRAFDVKTDDPATAVEMARRYDALGVTDAGTIAGLAAKTDLIFCTVTADRAVEAARAAAPHIAKDSFWCDLNSCAPSSKRTSAQIVEGAGGRYVDVAVMAPVHPRLNMVPLLVSGPHAQTIAPILTALPMNPTLVPGDVGAASTIKMIRSVMVKGLEALTAECVLAAVAEGIEEDILSSLLVSHRIEDWAAQSAYNFERVIRHGERRAAEMEEVAKTLSDLGLPNDMTRAAVLWQRRIAGAGLTPPKEPRKTGPKPIAESLLPHIRMPK